QRYKDAVNAVRHRENEVLPGAQALTEAVARALFKLMSYKDEYEVARLFSDDSFAKALAAEFESWDRLEPHLAPPVFGGRKRRFGPWMLVSMKILARLKPLRGTIFDPFGHTAERHEERALIAEYGGVIEKILQCLTVDNHAQMVAIAQAPLSVRGYGAIKSKSVALMRDDINRKLSELGKHP
ncbi:MAG: indolepyruvate ferredoxin oxidoreductase family protein, partial [Magnetospirillum sp.]|nr:indolepyruvate ferredoxin oxidoreductase family protein [Magnetospirillum sp.]